MPTCKHGDEISSHVPCGECVNDGWMAYEVCPSCDEGELWHYVGVCLNCGVENWHWTDPKVNSKLSRFRPCPECYPKFGNDSEFDRYNICFRCGNRCNEDLRWFYHTARKKEASDDEYLQDFEKTLNTILHPEPPKAAVARPVRSSKVRLKDL